MIEWFYGKGGQQFGPIDEVTLSARIATGEIGPQDLVWNEGMDSWKPLQEIRHLAPSGNDSQSQDSEGLTPELSQSSYAPPAEIKAPALDDSFVDEVPQSPYSPPVEGVEGASYTPGPSLPVTNGLAIASMICGILSLVFFCFCGGLFLGIPAVICGHLSLNQLNALGNSQQGRGMAIAGLICGYLGIAILIIMMLGGNGSSYQEI
ncbi:GYF domain-containing protein [Akkermansiaceae bacterium]|nr:GYF domain-containing protein [Akkermansiaceae bacterium]MDA8959358.1 GYF domain-containing protein [bacterium]MDA7675923.1 GYF domain-containing protein [Akkermansiaceae bacterium]MDA7682576.1 GYF domain-containing protein [Akkermansiaceae bacterium]MDA7910982.1 GYF domain-containing protein [Akkermansiaceae bacterium]